jgi:hypothetical protein
MRGHENTTVVVALTLSSGSQAKTTENDKKTRSESVILVVVVSHVELEINQNRLLGPDHNMKVWVFGHGRGHGPDGNQERVLLSVPSAQASIFDLQQNYLMFDCPQAAVNVPFRSLGIT